MSAYPHVAAVVMAGGKNSRFGDLGQAHPKCLLRLPDHETLLGRLLGQLRRAGVSDTVVCCSDENVSSIHSFLSEYRAKAGIPEGKVEGAACANCRAGPLPALAEALSKVRAQWYLLCLADIVFAAGPFVKAMGQLSLSDSGTVLLGSANISCGVSPSSARRFRDGQCSPIRRPDQARPDVRNVCASEEETFALRLGLDGLLITGTDRERPNGTGTGFVQCEQREVRAISYKAFGAKDSLGDTCRHWSGAFFFRAELLLDGRNDLVQHGAAPFENWIQQMLENGAHCEWTDGGPFFNVNSREDYEATLAFGKWNS